MGVNALNSFGTLTTDELGGQPVSYHSLRALESAGYHVSRLPYAHRILLENLLRNEDGTNVTKGDIEALLNWDAKAEPSKEIAFTPSRVLLQDFTGVPCVVDLASMRDAMAELGGDPEKINPLQPVELVIDHSVQIDSYGSDASLQINLDLEFERNNERYEFLKWGQGAFENFKVVPPNTGICHQVNLEYLGRVVMADGSMARLDTLVGTDSHTTMINGLGVLGWGVGGIEAEAAMLGQPVSMLIPQVVGFKLTGKLPEGATATDLVLTVTEMLRKLGVVGKFVEFYGPGITGMPLADRATIANMAPEYGATCGLFPVDEETLRYMTVSGRDESHIALVRDYYTKQGLMHTADSPVADYSATLELDLGTVQPSVAGPKRPQDRALLGQARDTFKAAFPDAVCDSGNLSNGSVVIAAITSCTNTSNPSVMVAAGLVARKARALGLKPKPWVKTSLAPGSRVVEKYLESAGLQSDLDAMGFNIAGFGCTTCIGNSGPLPEDVSSQVREADLAVVSVLSGNRNFEGRVNQDVKANYLMSPPLVVAYSLAGTIDIDLSTDPVAHTQDGQPVFLKDIWPSQQEIAETIEKNVTREMFSKSYASVFDGDAKWRAIEVGGGQRYAWDPKSTYVKQAPFFAGMKREAPSYVDDLNGLKCLAMLGDSVTTDHISPAGSIKAASPAGSYLIEHGVSPHLFNSYGARRGNDEVMVRGTFANIRLKNQLAPGTEGGFTTNFMTGEVTTIFDAAMAYRERGVGLVVLAGKEYGTGSSRDWAAKGTRLLGVKAVIAESFERIHRSNLIGMGVLPLQFVDGQNAESLGLTGQEEFSVLGLSEGVETKFATGKMLYVRATTESGDVTAFDVLCRLDTPTEIDYYRHGGVLQYVLRGLLG
ncbi:MAG: aconitate hydratase AcnA [Armatimonadetes bacterium]|nr:aconitate hydratase AcnA [Armatimonadota bacterium]MBX3108607.1 aconitate hydratase AcnA [Fimbriimonadaceae bacterium]